MNIRTGALTEAGCWGAVNSFNCPAVFIGNYWTGQTGPVPVSPETWGKIKGLYDEHK